jgi:hypothetical protein
MARHNNFAQQSDDKPIKSPMELAAQLSIVRQDQM